MTTTTQTTASSYVTASGDVIPGTRPQAQRTVRYAVVDGAGMHGSGEMVRAMYATTSLARARRMAARYTREYQRAMALHGGSSGRYVVVETDDDTRRGDAVGYGHAVDRYPRL